jgi:flagellar basal-body rod modification protein FlgD
MAISDSAAATSALTRAALGMEDFMRILLTQLTYQDPLKPMDNQEFMAQIAQFTALEQSQQANERLGVLVANQAALQSVGLIGRTVEVLTAAGTRASGTVVALSLAGEVPMLTLDGAAAGEHALGRVTAVR